MQTTIDKKAVEASFSKAAHYYDQYADLQREVGHHLMTLLPKKSRHANTILDLGCGTGYFAILLKQLNSKARLTCFDLSPKMLEQTKKKMQTNCTYVEGDIDKLPFTSPQFDLIFSNLVLQWSEGLQLSLKQAKQALTKDGVLCFSTLLKDSLIELQKAWEIIDDNQHVNDFLNEQQIESALFNAGYNNIKLYTETRIKKFSSVLSVMKALKGIGANHVHGNHHITSSGKKLLQQLDDGYQLYRDNDGLYNLSYQLCYVVAKQY